MKTNATRILDNLGIGYELREYAVDPDDLSAETVAAKIGLPAEQVFKTLVVRGDRGGVYLAVVAGKQRSGWESAGAADWRPQSRIGPAQRSPAAYWIHSRGSHRAGSEARLSGLCR
jgi:hypothetical protein